MDTNLVLKLNDTLTAMLTLPRISSGILLASFNTWSSEPPSSKANKDIILLHVVHTSLLHNLKLGYNGGTSSPWVVIKH
jgi:hypothetical protein